MQHLSLRAARRNVVAFALAAFTATPVAFVPAPVRAAEPIVMKIGTASVNDMQHEFMKRYADAVNKESRGRIKVEVYPARQLGSNPLEIEATQFGSIAAWVGPPEFLAVVDARYEALSAPNLFKDVAHAQRAALDKGLNDAFLGLGTDKGLIGLALFVHGPTAFDTRKEVKTADDLKGLKIRVLAAPLQMEQIARLGGTPVPMALDHVLPALQQGEIDGVMTDLPAFTSLRYADAAKYVYESEQSMLFSIAVLSKQWYDALPADLKPIVLGTGPKVARDLQPWIAQFNADQHKLWQSQGGSIITPSETQKKIIAAKMATVTADVLKDKPAVKSMVDLALAASARTAK